MRELGPGGAAEVIFSNIRKYFFFLDGADLPSVQKERLAQTSAQQLHRTATSANAFLKQLRPEAIQHSQ